MSGSKSRALFIAELESEALRLYSSGRSFRDVARMLSKPMELVDNGDDTFTTIPECRVSHMWVKRHVDKALADLAAESRGYAERARQLRLAKLRRFDEVLADGYAAGQLEAIDRGLRIIDLEAKLLGLYAPVAPGTDLGEGKPSSALHQRILEAQARVAAQEAALTAAEDLPTP